MQKIIKLLSLTLLLLLLTSCDEEEKSTQVVNKSAAKPAMSALDIELNNQGVGEMGSFDYTKATTSFEKLVSQNPNWILAQQNYAIALLNRQQPGDEEKAILIAKKLNQKDELNLVAHYIIAILNFNQGLCESALPHFEKIIAIDASDAYALYFAGQCALQNGKIEQSLSLYQQAITTDGYLRSAYYGSFMSAQRLGKKDIAQKMLQAYQKLGKNPKAKLAEIKYTRMGPKANAIAFRINPEIIRVPATTQPPYFKTPKKLTFDKVESFGIVRVKDQTKIYTLSDNQLSVSDLDSQNILENFSFELTANAGQIAWGDINNDGLVDFYSTGTIDQLTLQAEFGVRTVDMNNFGFKQLSSKAVRFADTDHDGDLDILLLNQQGQFELWNNNLDNTFSPLSTQVNLPKQSGFKAIYVEDIDSDRDLDIILVGDKEITTLLNDRMWDYQIIQSSYAKSIKSLTLADNNADGIVELSLLFNDSIGVFEFDKINKKYKKTNDIKNIKANSMLQVDVNGNAQSEYIVITDKAIKILNTAGKVIEQILLSNVENYKTLNTEKGAELLVLQNNKLIHIGASDNRAPFMLLNFSGKEDDANSVRSNHSGIGTNFTIHNQGFYAIGNTHNNLTGLDQDYQSTSIATGNKDVVDFLAVNWSDGVYQTELGLATQKFHKITETQRQLSSCPVIFAWNNGKYEFITDVLGVGGIGFAVGRHEYGVPRPWENYLLTNKQLSAKGGMFKLQFTEPMEESAYLDDFNIEVIDVPVEYNVLLDERMEISAPVVTGNLVFYKTKIQPKKITNQNNEDVTQAALQTDKIAIEIVNTDNRFLGIVDEQIITMEFAENLTGDYQFIMNGWVEYGYSQTMFAAWQAGKSAQAPTIEYYADGKWHVLLKEFGYPAGMPRESSVPVNIPVETNLLRIRTNMEVYFDELSLVKTQKVDAIKKYQLPLFSAHLKQLGFPKRDNNEQRVPSYDTTKIKPFWDTRYMEGAYTQLGEIKELVEKKDNALAIIGAGEAIEFNFVDDLPPLAEGFERYYLLKFTGWAKDMDILTKNGETLTPIPSRGKVSVKAGKLNQKYNTRFKAGK